MWFLAAAAVVGTAMQVYGQIKGAKDQEEAAKRQQDLIGQQVQEMRYRQAINERVIRTKNEEMEGLYRVRAAAMGGGGHGIADMIRNQKIMEENIADSRHELNYKIKQAELGAQIQTDLYSDQVAASYISGAGSLLASGAKAYQLGKSYG